MPQDSPQPDQHARRLQGFRLAAGVLLALSVVAGIAMLGVLFVASMDPFADETVRPADYRFLYMVAALPWLLAGSLAAVRIWLGRRLQQAIPSMPG